MAQQLHTIDADLFHVAPNTATLSDTDRSTLHRLEFYDELLAIDLSRYRTNADKLFEYCETFQGLCRKQRSEIAKLRAEASENLTKSPSKGSTRRKTDDSGLSQKKKLNDIEDEIAVEFRPSDNGLRIVRRRDVKGKKFSDLRPSCTMLTPYADSKYIQAALPSFHWWQDYLHIYFGKSPDRKSATHGQPEVVVLKEELKSPSDRDLTFIRTIKLGGLGFRIKWRRMTGNLNTIYVLSPEPQNEKSN
jgi:hypothetical protein